MNKRQKEVQQKFLDTEKETIRRLEENYRNAMMEIEERIENLLARSDADMQYVIYQVQYQQALVKQIDAIIETLRTNEFETISEYLTVSYEDGFIGTMYDLHGQGVPFILPIDQKQVVEAIQNDTKLSESLYEALGKDTKKLSRQIAAEISRGLSTAATYSEIARNVVNASGIPRNNAVRIARTESHRIQCKAAADAQWKAKERGADIVKQWDSTLDGRTRTTHIELDGQIRELDEPFEVAGMKAMQPGAFGRASEDCNCRCALLQRARWALDRKITKWDQETGGIVEIDPKDYKDFKSKYMKESERVRSNVQKMNTDVQIKKLENQFSKLTDGYSYDDFIRDFGSIENGFDGSTDDEIKKAKEISKKIESLRGKQISKNNVIRTKQESIEALKRIGIDLKDVSKNPVSNKVLSKYVDFVTSFENNHAGYFALNSVNLKSISIVDEVKLNGGHASGIYREKTNAIEILRSRIKSEKSSGLSMSDDFEVHHLAHEYGHYISDSLEKTLGIKESDIIQASLLKYYDGDIWSASIKNLKDCLGAYGSTSYQEAFAEAFAEAYSCKEPRKFASIFREELEKVIGNTLENNVKSSTIELKLNSSKQLGKKIGKHAEEFGLDASKESDRNKVMDIIKDIHANADTIKIGSWRGQKEDVLFYIKGKDVVITKQNGDFVTVMEGASENGGVKNARIK